MTTFSTAELRRRALRVLRRPALWLLLVPLIYLATLARTPVIGDPTEYTFVAHVLGVAHPPGYALITLLGKLYQTLIPFGTIAWRMHLLGLTAGSVAVVALYGTLTALLRLLPVGPLPSAYGRAAALVAALALATAANVWQHSIHANPHIITAAFLAVNTLLLTRWYVALRSTPAAPARADRWLYAFCLSVGLGVTHHPLTVFALPASVLFVLLVRPRIALAWRTLLTGALWALLGLAVWLYFPLRAPALAGTQFVANMNTLDGFLDVALARGLRVNLFAFGLRDQWDRLTVFWSLLRLQFALPLIALASIGVGWLALARARRPLLVLFGGAFLLNYLFVINSVQDVMAYLLGPFWLLALLAGAGLLGLLDALARRPALRGAAPARLLLALIVLFGPLWNALRNAPFVSLADYDEGNATIAAVRAQFDGRGERAVLLNDWEHMTPLWYEQLVNRRAFDPTDVTPVFVSSARPWLDNVFERLPGGPVYLSRFERSVFDAGFRLRQRGEWQQVVEPGAAALPPELTPLAGGNGVALVGYALPQRTVTAGDFVRLTLALRADATPPDVYMPVLSVGPLSYPFTTDSHLLTTDYRPGEVIVEGFDFALPHTLPAGDYPLTVQMRNLSQNVDVGPAHDLGVLQVGASAYVPRTDGLIANYRQRVGLAAAQARVGLAQRRSAPWDAPLVVRADDTIHLTLTWRVLARPEDSYTVFVHLIDLANRPLIDNLDYTPLGGAMPSHLWFAKWLPGQTVRDPYQMALTGVPPGDYLIEVGFYEQFTLRRLHMHDAAGNLIGDRAILGAVSVTP